MMEQAAGIRAYEGATAIITGGASGLGCALGKALSARGCEVVLADRQIELATAVAGEIVAAGGKARAAELDVVDFDAFKKVVDETVAQSGRLDYLFNNAGIGVGGPVERLEVEHWNQIIDVNIRGVVHGSHAAYPIMEEQGYGHIINTASMAGLMPTPGMVPYGTTKYAVVGLSHSWRIEAALKGVRVSALCPGAIRTPILGTGGKFGVIRLDLSEEELKSNWEKVNPMDPDAFAVEVLDRVIKNDATIIAPRWWRVIWWMNRLCPPFGRWFAERNHRHLLRKERSKAIPRSSLR